MSVNDNFRDRFFYSDNEYMFGKRTHFRITNTCPYNEHMFGLRKHIRSTNTTQNKPTKKQIGGGVCPLR